ncbi:MAG: hypothetical protein GY791_09170 [Alphaproteobacteria bacterium]|nr:hypothetical protein [Alphaproteobacteria bacterium]
MFGSKKRTLLQSLWSAEILPPEGVTGAPVGIMFFQAQRAFGDFFEAGRILGGDDRHFIAGAYTIEDYRLTGDMTVTHYAGDPEPTWGQAQDVEFAVSATLDANVDRDVFMIVATPRIDAAQPMRLRLTRRIKLE